MADRRRLLARPVARQQSWYRITNKTAEVAEVYIYDEISWFGITAQDFVDELREVKADRIDLHLNSPGGDVFDGFAIYQALVDHKAQVHVMVDGLAASAASFIAMAGERVEMGQAAMLMIHDAWGLAIGNAADMRDLAERLDKISNTIAGIYAAHAGGPLDFWREAMVAETWYDANEAVEAGLADTVRARKTDDDQDKAGRPEDRWDLSVFTYAGRAKAPAPKLRPAAAATPSGDLPPGGVPPAQPAPVVVVDASADDPDVFPELPADALASLSGALDDVFDDMGSYDPDLLKHTILDVYGNAPAPPTLPPAPQPPRTTFSIDELIGAIQEGVAP